jgi:beta-glucosidase
MAISTFADARDAVRAGTSPEEAARALVATMTEDERLWCLDGDAPTWAGATYLTSQDGYHKAPFLAAVVDRVGLPGIAFSDGPRGAVIGNATCFPVSMARGATWDPELEERVGLAIGRELRALGANLTGAVCVNVLRHPAWGRAQETYGEDPFHVGEHGAALTRGLQQHVMASAKHFVCNSMENARFTVDIEVDEVALHEVYLPHFRRIVDEGVASIMSAYNSVNGEWCGHSRPLLTDILRHEWGFQGFVISDWVFGMRDAAASLHGGLDIEMPWRMIRAQHLRAALDDGQASWDDVDTAVAHTVATLLRFDDVLSAEPPSADVIGSAEHRALAREVAARSVVLLRNEPVDGTPVLPMAASSRVAVLGRLADTVNLGDAGSSDVWDLECRTVLDGLRDAVAEVVHDDGLDVERAAQVAAGADIAVVVAGYTYLDEGEYLGEMDASMYERFPPGDEPDVVDLFQSTLVDLPPTEKPPRLVDRPPTGFGLGGDKVSLRLPAADVELIRAVAAANPRTVVALQTGSAVVVSEWIDLVPAAVYAWYGGCEAGPGLADVLLGAENPSARLPFSVPVHEDDLPAFDRDATHFVYDRWHGWWHFARTGTAPQFPFGFGLAYTDFVLGDVDVSVGETGIEVRATVTNTGDRDGADVVQVSAALPDPGAPPRLAGFARVEVPAGGTADVAITVPRSRLETRDPDAHSWRAPAGAHRITVGRHAGDPDAVTVPIEL